MASMRQAASSLRHSCSPLPRQQGGLPVPRQQGGLPVSRQQVRCSSASHAPVRPSESVSARSSVAQPPLHQDPSLYLSNKSNPMDTPPSAELVSSEVVAAPASSILQRLPKRQVYLFYCQETAELARKVAEEGQGSIQLRPIQWGQFADGFPNLFVPEAQEIRNRHVAFLASFSSPSVIFEQLSIIYALPRMFIASFTLVLPFFPTGTVERMEDEGDIATAFTLSRILSNIPISRGGPTSLVIFDIHALQERFYFGDKVLPCFESGIPILKEKLRKLEDAENVSIAFPDEGAWKRFHKQFAEWPTVICTKVRDGSKRIVRLKEGDPAGRHVIIVDDLVQSGSTLIECQKVLAALGAQRVSAYATHGVFPRKSWERFLHRNGGETEGGFAHFWITDSCPHIAEAVEGKGPFEILSLAGPIAASLHI